MTIAHPAAEGVIAVVEAAMSASEGKTVLVVDDDETVRRVLRLSLEFAGFRTPTRVFVTQRTKARQPDPLEPSVPPVAAVCVYPSLVQTCVRELSNGGPRRVLVGMT